MEEKVFFKNANGSKLCGVLSDPTGDKTKTIVIICHGYNSSKDRPSYTSFSSKLYELGIASFRFDFFGNGESEGKIEDLTFSEAVEDIHLSIQYLKTLEYTNVGLFGSSFGGTAALIAASKTNELSFLSLRCPIPNYEDRAKQKLGAETIVQWKRTGFLYNEEDKVNMKYSFYEDFKNNDGYEAAKKVLIPTCIVVGDADEFVPIEQIYKIQPLLQKLELTVISGADHQFTNKEHNKHMFETLMKFIMKHVV